MVAYKALITRLVGSLLHSNGSVPMEKIDSMINLEKNFSQVNPSSKTLYSIIKYDLFIFSFQYLSNQTEKASQDYLNLTLSELNEMTPDVI